MKRTITVAWLLLMLVYHVSMAGTPFYLQTKDGVTVYTDPSFTGTSNTVRLYVITDDIIRVVAAPGKELRPVQSLMRIDAGKPAPEWKLTASQDAVTLKTKKLTVTVGLKTGTVSFLDAKGEKILAEKSTGGRTFRPTTFDGQPYYQLTQQFEGAEGEGWYGLGQHQDGIYNYKGQQVNFFQNNTEVAIPFLVSHKNYGILWDNYSLTTAGDIRPLYPLSALQLFSKNDEEGWLTATYANDARHPQQVITTRAESAINMEFLGDSKVVLPQAFTPATGMASWEGSLASHVSGLHQLRFTFGGTLKVWLNGKLVLDHWRKAWNPAPALVPVNFEKGVKVAVRIEWTPESPESYLSLKWQAPLSKEERRCFGFSSEAGHQVDYYFVHGGNIDEVIAGYRELTGKAPIVPKWAMGFWQSRERYKTQEEVLSTVDQFRKKNIPLDNIVLDWSYWKETAWGSQEFDAARFPSPDSMIDVLHKKYHTQIMISVWPKFYKDIPAYHEFDKKGWLYKRNIADEQRDWIGKGYVSTFYDAFNEDARKGFWDLINQKLYTKGIDAWWMDASEPDVLSNVSPEKRKLQMTPTALGPAAEYVNAYPLQNAKGIYEGQRHTDPDKRVFLLTRSGFGGSQRYAAAIWSGDIGATWRDMQTQITAGINFSLSGLPYWTMDIGGFVVPAKFEKPDAENLEEWRELCTRWTQFGAFVPLFRSHGQFPYREIFNTAPEDHPAYESFLYYDKLRYRLLPYSYSLAGAAYHENYTIMRGLVMDFAKDTTVLNIGDQFMFGPSLLVNPVYQYKQRSREVYLPAGQGWYDVYTGAWNAGGKRISADAPYGRMPLYAREGAIIPVGPALQYTAEKPADTITLYVYAGKNGNFRLYEDDGSSYNYEKGQFTIIPLDYDENTKTLTIGDRKGAYNGMLQQRIFRIVRVSAATPKPLDPDGKADQEIRYEGKKMTIKI
ncbi:DUF5110 domain-containing protein [Chitinophaga varians]|nr:DUF5110 domain-containing protein [Chitinophaga varians]